MSVLKHVANIHTWYGGQCEHSDLDGAQSKTWLDKDSKPMQALREIVADQKWQFTLPFYVKFRYIICSIIRMGGDPHLLR